jgi:hypothetical protein
MYAAHCPLLTFIALSNRVQYHVITAYEVPKKRWLTGEPDPTTTSANRSLLPPDEDDTTQRTSNVNVTAENVLRKGQTRQKKSSSPTKKRSSSSKGKQVDTSGDAEQGHAPLLKGKLQQRVSSTSSTKSDRSQRVDLIVEDTVAEERERARARKEGSAVWNEVEPKRFVFVFI